MIGFWNKKEVYIGYSMAEYANIRDILVANQIKYTYKTVSSSSGNRRGVIGSFGESAELSCMYYIYVHKNDYNWVCKLIQDHK